ncbi:hypothetical protein NA56DRAFT_626137 [Hyaloscypha hepaticicola]|uniref:Uncharacterized protein n=1 Tax=Hyaloscypha hepaticicola TaxID=2082293 RepID=A0A2J6Q5E1_9HELO|nr:hypothetical protein NA56DRAFT_626137 [Hyaloscypha hepaticicola]
MAPPPTRTPSRPPITSRIRSSFEKRRRNSNEPQSPNYTNGTSPFFTQDAESLRKAIDEAISSETFQNAIAANLAKLIKPSIKSALDTIQPVVEAVYNHEVLLRKTNHSVENILERLEVNTDAHGHQRESRAIRTPSPSQDFAQFRRLLDESNARTAAALSELSSSVEASNGKITEALQGISSIQAALGPTKENVDGLKVFSEQSTTTAAVMQAQLDQLQADVGQVIDAIGADLGKNVKALHEKAATWDSSILSSHTTKLDALATDLGALKGHSDTMEKIEALSTELTGLKGSVEAGISSNNASFTSLGSQITNVLSTIEGHTNTLGEIKDKAADPEILAALQQSNNSHASHTAALSEIKERSLSAAPAPVSVPEGGNAEATAALQDLKADLASLKENIAAGLTANNENVTGLGTKIDSVLSTVEAHKASDASPEILAAVQQSNESHASHSAVLEELKSRGAEPAPAAESGNLVALEAQVGSIASVLDAHTAALDEIKTAGSSHAAALDEVKSISSAPTATRSIGETPPPADNSNLAALEAQVAAIVATLESHTAVLDHIKASSDSTSAEVVPSSKNEALEGHFSTIVETLDAHTNLLNEIKDDVSAEILTTLHELGQSQAHHSDMLAEIREADVSDEILTLLHAHGESQAGHGATLGQIHEGVQALQESHAAHGAALDEIKSRSVEPAPATKGSNDGALEAKIDGIASTLESHKATLASIQESHASHAEAHASHTAALTELKAIQSATAPDASRPESPDIVGLETQLNNIITALERQTATLSSLRDSASDKSILEATLESHDLLTSHTALLNTIKEKSSHDDILSNLTDLKALVQESKSGIDEHSNLVRDLRSDTKETHSSLKSAIAGLALGGAAGAGAGALVGHESDKSLAEILFEVKAVKEKVDLVVSQIEINHTTITTCITTLSDELKAEIDATGTQITESITTMDATLKEIDLRPITSSVEQTGQVVKDLSSQIDNLESHIQDNTSKVNEIHQGVHLNDTGISQLREHAGTREVVSEPVPEGMWFGSGSGSPSAKRLPNPFEYSIRPAAPTEAAPEYEAAHEVAEEEPELEPPLEQHEQEPEAEPVEEATEAASEHESAHKVPVAEPVVEDHEPKPEPEPEPELANEPTEPTLEPEAHELSEPQPVLEHHELEVEPAEEAIEAVPEHESAHEVAEPEPVLEHHEQEAEAEPTEEPTEITPEHESAHEAAESEPVVEHQEPKPEPEPEPEPANEPADTAPEPETSHDLPEAKPLEEHHAPLESIHSHEAADESDLPAASHTEPEPHQVDPEEED